MTPISDGVTPMNTPDALTIQTRHTGQLGGARPGAGRPVKPWEDAAVPHHGRDECPVQWLPLL